jgi:hypothetical protein
MVSAFPFQKKGGMSMKRGTVALLVLVAFLAGAGLMWWIYLRRAHFNLFDEGGVEATCTNSAANKCDGIYMVDVSVPKCDVDLPIVTLHLNQQPRSITWYSRDSPLHNYQYQVRFANSPFPASDSPPYPVGPATSQHTRDSGAPQHYFAYSIWYNASGIWKECKSDYGDPRDDDPGIKIRN